MVSVFSFLHSEKVNINQGCTTNSRLMRYYFLLLERAKAGFKKILLLAGPSLWRDVDNLPIAETTEVSDKAFQMEVSGP